MSAEVHVQAQISPFFCSQVVFRFNLSREAKIKEGKILAPKDLVRCLLGKNVHFLEARCLDSIWVSGVGQ
jgi:hypothetical protein